MSSDNWTYALCKISTVEKAVFREGIEVALDLAPCIDGVISFGADKSENTESLMSAGSIPVKLSQFPPPSTSLQGHQGAILSHCRGQRSRRRVAVAPREPPH
jgi:hypothetical protein